MNITQAHAYCAALPGATRDIKWENHAVFSVGGKIFAMFTIENGKPIDQVSFKTDDARFLELTDREGFVPAPYLARAKWVKLDGIKRLGKAEAKALLSDAHRVVMAKLSKTHQRRIMTTDDEGTR